MVKEELRRDQEGTTKSIAILYSIIKGSCTVLCSCNKIHQRLIHQGPQQTSLQGGWMRQLDDTGKGAHSASISTKRGVTDRGIWTK